MKLLDGIGASIPEGTTSDAMAEITIQDSLVENENISMDAYEDESNNQYQVESNGSWIGALIDRAIDALGSMFNKLLLSIADAIQDLIDGVFGTSEPLTVYQVVFGKIDKLSINFWEGSSNNSIETGTEETLENPSGIVDSAPAPVLKDIVGYWYGILNGIATTIYLAMLLYIGVRILLASTGSSKQTYKERLTSWVVGIIILMFFPNVMRYVISINNTFVGMLDSNIVNIDSDGDGVPDDVMTSIRTMAEEEDNLALTIVYIIMLGQLIVLLGVYYKRVFMVAFLITIFPIVATLYIWDKIGKGSAKSFSAWTKEFVLVILTQTFHAVVYAVLIEGAFAAVRDANNWLMYIFCVSFLFKAEGIIRSIFDMKSSAKTMGELAASGAVAWGTVKAAKDMFKSNSKSKSKDKDKDDLAEATEEVNEYKKQTAINNTLRTMTAASGIAAHSSGESESGHSAVEGASEELSYQDLRAAQAVIRHEALKDKTKKGMFAKALGTTTDVLTRTAGITLGVTSGIAAGDLKTGVANAVVFNEVAGLVSKGIKTITGYVHGAYRGQELKRKVLSGELDDKFREVGVDMAGEFDPNPEISSAKARLFREALSEQISGTRSGGTEKGELKFVDSVDKGTKKETF